METRYLHNEEAGDAHIVVMCPYRDVMAAILLPLSRVDLQSIPPPSVIANVAANSGCNILRAYELRGRCISAREPFRLKCDNWHLWVEEPNTGLFFTFFVFYLASDRVIFLLNPEISFCFLHVIPFNIFAPVTQTKIMMRSYSLYLYHWCFLTWLSQSLFLFCSWSARILGACDCPVISFYVFPWIFVHSYFIVFSCKRVIYWSLNKLGRDFMDTLCYTFKEFFVLIC